MNQTKRMIRGEAPTSAPPPPFPIRRVFPLHRYRYQIDRDVPIPPHCPKGRGGARTPLFPFFYLEPGDSFFVPYDDYGPTGWVNVNTAINSAQQRCEMRFCWRVRTLAQHGESGWRIWRTS